MPLFAVAVVVYAVGLLFGFWGHLWLPVGLALTAVIAGIHTQRSVIIGLGMVLLGGAWVARAATVADGACETALVSDDTVTVVLSADAAPGTFAAGTVVGCHAPIGVSVERGSALAGSVVHVRATIARTNRGLVAQHAVVRVAGRGPWLLRWRLAAGRRVDRLFGSDAPLARALLVADRGEIPADVRDRYAAAGLAHMLSISGLHVSLIAMAVELILATLRVPRQRAGVATLVIVGAYVAMLGAPSPAFRAAVMLGLLVLSRRCQRPTSPWAILAVGAAFPLVDPRAVTGVGYQLSVAGVAALIAAAQLARRWPWMARRRGVARGITMTMLASMMATVVTAPLVAWNFGRLSLVGPLANVVAAPLMGIVQPMIFLALATSPVPLVARWFADGAHPLLRAFDGVAATAAGIPHAAVAVTPSAFTVGLGLVFAVALIVACVTRFPGRAMTTAAVAVAFMAWAPLAPVRAGRTELHVIDVGQGNAVALRTARGHWVLFDAGRAWRGGDDARSTIVPYVGHRGGTVTAFVLSDTRADNIGGVGTLLRALRPGEYFDGVAGGAPPPYAAALRAARAEGIPWRRIQPGDSIVVDEATIRFLAPDPAWAAERGASRAAVVAQVQIGAVRLLLAGDVTAADERRLVARGTRALRSDVLLVGRHGSDAATTPEFLRAVAPRVAVIAVGAMGSRDEPGRATLGHLTAAGVQVFRTDQLSTIVVSTDGTGLRVSAAGNDWIVDR